MNIYTCTQCSKIIAESIVSITVHYYCDSCVRKNDLRTKSVLKSCTSDKSAYEIKRKEKVKRKTNW